MRERHVRMPRGKTGTRGCSRNSCNPAVRTRWLPTDISDHVKHRRGHQRCAKRWKHNRSRPSRKLHHCLHFRPVRKGSIPWNIGRVSLALIIPRAPLTIAFRPVPFSLSLCLFVHVVCFSLLLARYRFFSLPLSLSYILSASLPSVRHFSLRPTRPRSMTRQMASSAY